MLAFVARNILPMSSLRPVVVSGPSGTGKSTLLKKLFEEFPDAFGFCVSHTTRQRRNGEEDGKQYHFTDIASMKKEIDDGKFVEYAQFSGNMYGTSKAAIKDVLDQNRICILDIDEQGVKSIKQSNMEALYVFIKPPSLEELEKRLRKRGTETEESIEKRMKTVKSAIEYSEQADTYDMIVVNDELEKAYVNVKDFLQKAFPSISKVPRKYDPALELPLAASVKTMGSNSHGANTNGGISNTGYEEVELDSVAEIPLSPNKAPTENPAVVIVGETPLLLVNDISEMKSEDSSVMVELVDSNDTPSAVCGKQSWCLLL